MSSLSDIFYFPSGSHLKSIRYNFFFFALTFPPVAFYAPVNMLRPFFASSTVSSRGMSIVGATCMIMDSSTKQYPTRWKESREMLHLKATMWPASLRQFRKVELMVAHIYGSDPFPWSDPCGGGFIGIAHISHP